MKQFFVSSLRQKLLIPTITIMLVCIAGLSLTVLSVQKSQLSHLEQSVNSDLENTNKTANKNYTRLEKEVTQALQEMNQILNTSIAQTTRVSLAEEKVQLETELNEILYKNAASIADLLGRVAPPAILTNNFIDLIAYAKSATNNPDVVYAVYMRTTGKPMTRFLDKSSPLIQEYLKTGKEKNKVIRVITASKNDPNVFLVERPVTVENKELGKVIVCVDKASAQKNISELSHRFDQLIAGNAAKGKVVIEQESSKLNQRISGQLQDVSAKSIAAAKQITDKLNTTTDGMHTKIRLIVLTVGGVSIFAMFTILYLFLTRITRTIGGITTELDRSSNRITSASEQVASASQNLAEGSAQQAASIEETSASLEEMASMTKQNADNADQADSLMKETNQVVESANNSMDELTKSMEDISVASTETSKIIKTIDEIAFQTNLLALNAAVEAARAGEAGAGFAVVADEVRNLAIRAADAARDTADLIQGTEKKVGTGKLLVTRANDAFGKVAQSASKVGQLVAEIAAASSDQAQGIDQVNTAVNEMDKVVQQNATGSEETSSNSEEMRNQAEQMKEMILKLVKMVSGRKGDDSKDGFEPEEPEREEKALRTPGKNTQKTRATLPPVPSQTMAEVRADQIIDLDDHDDFRDF